MQRSTQDSQQAARLPDVARSWPLVAYLVAFYGLWTAGRLALVAWGAQPWLGMLMKLLIWALPVFPFVRRMRRQTPSRWLKLDVAPTRQLGFTVAVACAVAAYQLLARFLLYGHAPLLLGGVRLLDVVMVAPMTEELLFRGLVLQAMQERLRFWPANLLTSALFMLAHYPIWLLAGQHPMALLLNSAFVFAASLLFGYAYRRTGSLWAPMLIHAVINLFGP